VNEHGDRIIGRRLDIPRNPEEAAAELTAVLGGRVLASRWLRAAEKALEDHRD